MQLVQTQEELTTNQVVADKHRPLLPYVAPLKSEQAIFVLLGTSRDPIPHNRGRLKTPSFFNVTNSFQLLGTDNRSLVPVKYSKGQIKNEKTGNWEDDYTEIVFQMGQLIVSKYEPDLYLVLMLHPENESNPYRDKRKPATFKLLDIEGDKGAEFDKEDFLLEALLKFRGESNMSKVACFARAIGVNASQDAKSIRWDCMQRLKKEPELIALFGTALMKIKAVTHLAFEAGIVEFNNVTIEIGFKQNKFFHKITAVPMGIPGDQIKEFFSNWLKNDQTGVYSTIIERLKIEGYGDEIFDEEEEMRLQQMDAQLRETIAPDTRIFGQRETPVRTNFAPPVLTDNDISRNSLISDPFANINTDDSDDSDEDDDDDFDDEWSDEDDTEGSENLDNTPTGNATPASVPGASRNRKQGKKKGGKAKPAKG